MLLAVCFSMIAIEGCKKDDNSNDGGGTIVFSKEAMADFTIAANQDRITDNVWITRGDTKGIYNIKIETEYDGGDTYGESPLDTEWAFGTVAGGVSNLNFTTWAVAMDGGPPSQLNKDMVVHLITDDIYLDIKFTSWGMGANGGGSFSYERSTVPQ